MFTGLIEGLGRVGEFARHEGGARLAVEVPEKLLEGVQPGDSVAVNGLCLTVADMPPGGLCFDLVPQSLRCSNLGALSAGDEVNLERALKLGDRLGGHLVSGHIDCTAQVQDFQRADESVLTLSVDETWGRYLFSRGSVALDGVSLTLADVQPADSGKRVFSVCLIPTTLAETNLDRVQPGDALNLETDQLARYVVESLQRTNPDRTPPG